MQKHVVDATIAIITFVISCGITTPFPDTDHAEKVRQRSVC